MKLKMMLGISDGGSTAAWASNRSVAPFDREKMA
jgi:hypothetical protein